MSDRKIIEARIAELRGQLAVAEGRQTEVYSRIVGYYRSVRNWNAGKREEYRERLGYVMPAAACAPVEPAAAPAPSAAQAGPPPTPLGVAMPGGASLKDGILVFTRETCPNCPPVASYVLSSGVKAVFVDVDLEEGLSLARDLGVMATPTVLGLDAEGREAFRAFDVKGLRTRLESRKGESLGLAF